MISPDEADLARTVPMADDLTAEADSGGHTDNRPALTLLPTMMALRDTLTDRYGIGPHRGWDSAEVLPRRPQRRPRFAMGAAYILTGSINQACVEAGTSEAVRRMLADAVQADVVMAPAADMFEMGVKVQVLKRGTLFAVRAAKLYDFYRRYDRYEDIPGKQRTMLERDYFRRLFRRPGSKPGVSSYREIPGRSNGRSGTRATKWPWCSGPTWPIFQMGDHGDATRQMDYQIWCGPSMGAFNQWVRGTFLEKPESRETVTLALNLLYGASVVTRSGWLRLQGVPLPPAVGRFAPMAAADIRTILDAPV